LLLQQWTCHEVALLIGFLKHLLLLIVEAQALLLLLLLLCCLPQFHLLQALLLLSPLHAAPGSLKHCSQAKQGSQDLHRARRASLGPVHC
jgi:hypothetical protein